MHIYSKAEHYRNVRRKEGQAPGCPGVGGSAVTDVLPAFQDAMCMCRRLHVNIVWGFTLDLFCKQHDKF